MLHVEGRTAAAVLVFIICNAAGDLILSQGMRQMGPFPGLGPSGLLRFMQYIVTAPKILAGTALLTVGFASFLAVLSWADVSIVVPASAGTHLIVTLLARYLLHEQVPAQRWTGVFIVMVGIGLVLGSEKAPAASPSAKVDEAVGRTTTTGRPVRAYDMERQVSGPIDAARARIRRSRHRGDEQAPG